MEKPSRNQILASSSGWVAVTLNLLPGLGVGYIYQRRWKAYWLTGALSLLWGLIGLVRQLRIDPIDPISSQSDQIAFYGFLFIAVYTACEAGLTVKNTRKALSE